MIPPSAIWQIIAPNIKESDIMQFIVNKIKFWRHFIKKKLHVSPHFRNSALSGDVCVQALIKITLFLINAIFNCGFYSYT